MSGNEMLWTILLILVSSLLVALVALCAVYVLYIKEDTLQRWMPRLIAVAVGVLLGDAFLHLLPDALEIADEPGSVLLWALLGILGFYGIEHGLHWRHDHQLPEAKLQTVNQAPLPSLAQMNLLGDGMHNFVDGILIAASFLADPLLGLGTTMAIIIHEIPQEISDIAVLIKGGLEKRRAVQLNFLCALCCPLGAVVTIALAQTMALSLSALLSVTAGGFIYIATTDLMPLLRQEGMRLSFPVQFSATFTGIMTMVAILGVEVLI